MEDNIQRQSVLAVISHRKRYSLAFTQKGGSTEPPEPPYIRP